MDAQTIFWLLMFGILIQVIMILVLGSSIKAAIEHNMSQKDNERKNTRGTKNGLKTILLLITMGIPSWMFAAEETVGSNPMTLEVNTLTLSVLLAINITLLGIVWYLRGLLKSLLEVQKTDEELALEKEKAKVKTQKIIQVFTDAVPVEEEKEIEMDHEYDGIRELDNNLPPWWKWGFYVSIFFAILYLINYHVLKIGDLQAEEYHKTIVEEEAKVAQYLKDQAMNVDENTVTLMIEPSDLAAGQALFTKYCKVCHGGAGEGMVGPNLTDKYWIHGGRINDIFKTIKYGAQNGMKSWKEELNPIQMQQVSSFIKSIANTNPPNAKEPQGDLYEEETLSASNDKNEEIAENMNASDTTVSPE